MSCGHELWAGCANSKRESCVRCLLLRYAVRLHDLGVLCCIPGCVATRALLVPITPIIIFYVALRRCCTDVGNVQP